MQHKATYASDYDVSSKLVVVGCGRLWSAVVGCGRHPHLQTIKMLWSAVVGCGRRRCLNAREEY